MEILDWCPVFYNGLETNVEITKCGRVRKVKVDWYGKSSGSYLIKYGEVDFNKLKKSTKYKQIGIQIKQLNPKTVYVHQLVAAAFLEYKFQGNNLVVDHIDSNPLNNNLKNLRVISNRENNSKERTIKSGLPTGVSLCKNINKYTAEIHINNKSFFLGRYKTVEEASQAYQNKLNSIT